MDFLANYLIIISISIVAMISPGPDLLIVLRNSLGLGRKHGIATALGIGSGLIIHVTYCVLGIAFIISQSIMMFSVIKYVGAAYLLWLGYKSLKSKGWAVDPEKAKNKQKTVFAAFREGFITNAFNPKATMFFLALFTQVVAPNTPMSWQLLYGVTIIALACIWFSIVSVVLTNPQLRSILSKFSVWIDRVTGVLLVGLGLKIITEKATL
ncbi:MAG: amino acid transporter [Micavibrio sp.]|nr:amino acid transporter [Micavibrio sp.]